jgi:hypothetical protein
LSQVAAAAIHYEDGPGREQLRFNCYFACRRHCAAKWTERDFGTSPIYKQLSNKPQFALINLHGVPNANHNGGSRGLVLKTLLSSASLERHPRTALLRPRPWQKGTRRRCTDIGQNVPPRDQQVRLPQWVKRSGANCLIVASGVTPASEAL